MKDLEVSDIPLDNCFGLAAVAVVVFAIVETVAFDVAVVFVVAPYFAWPDVFASCRCSN